MLKIPDSSAPETEIRDRDKERSLPSPVQYWFLLVASLYLYVNLFVFPNIPIYLDGDQTFFWEYALRMLHGQRVYRDFFQFTPPGTDLYYLAFFKLFGARPRVIDFSVLLLGVALCWISFSIARRLMTENQALLASALFLVLPFNTLLDATHHWFSLLAVLCAVRVLMPSRTPPRIALAGLFLGTASFFTQTAGAAALLALLLFLAWEGFCTKKTWRATLGCQSLLIAAFALTLAALSAYLLAKVGWKQLWYFQVVYPQHYLIYREEGVRWQLAQRPTRSGLAGYLERRFIYALLFLMYPVALWRSWRERRNPRSLELALLSLAGLFLFLEVLPRANWTRIYAVSMPALILFVWALSRRGIRRSLTMAIWTILFCLAAEKVLSRHRQNHLIARLPAGKAALSRQKYEEFSWLMQHTRPGDLFFQANWLNVYPPLELRTPAFVDALTSNDVTRPEFVALTIRQLESRHVEYILWAQGLGIPESPDRPWENHLGPLRAYLKSHYRRVKLLPGPDSSYDEVVWQRR